MLLHQLPFFLESYTGLVDLSFSSLFSFSIKGEQLIPGLLAPLPVQHRISEMRESLTGHMKQASSLAHPSLPVGCLVPLCSYGEMLGTVRNTNIQSKRQAQVPSEPGCISTTKKKDNSKTGAHTVLQLSIHGLESSLACFWPMAPSTSPANTQACYKLWLVPGAVPGWPSGCAHVDMGHTIQLGLENGAHHCLGLFLAG